MDRSIEIAAGFRYVMRPSKSETIIGTGRLFGDGLEQAGIIDTRVRPLTSRPRGLRDRFLANCTFT